MVQVCWHNAQNFLHTHITSHDDSPTLPVGLLISRWGRVRRRSQLAFTIPPPHSGLIWGNLWKAKCLDYFFLAPILTFLGFKLLWHFCCNFANMAHFIIFWPTVPPCFHISFRSPLYCSSIGEQQVADLRHWKLLLLPSQCEQNQSTCLNVTSTFSHTHATSALFCFKFLPLTRHKTSLDVPICKLT